MLNCEAQSVEKNEAEHKILEIRRIDDQPNTVLPRVTRHVTRDRLGLKGIFLSMVRNKLNYITKINLLYYINVIFTSRYLRILASDFQ